MTAFTPRFLALRGTAEETARGGEGIKIIYTENCRRAPR